DDAAVTAPDHMAHGGPGAVHHALEVDVQHVLPILRLHADEQGVPGSAGVVDHNVQLAKALDDLFDESLRLLAVGQVCAEPVGLRALRPQLGRHSLCLLLAAAVHRHRCAFRRQAARYGQADATGAAGHKGRPTRKSHVTPPPEWRARTFSSPTLSPQGRHSRSGAMRLMSPHKVRPSPTSTTHSTPMSIMRRTLCSHSTGRLTCSIRQPRTASAVVTGAALTLAMTGMRGSRMTTSASTSARRRPAGSSSRQWNGPLTFNSCTRRAPAARASSRHSCTAAA